LTPASREADKSTSLKRIIPRNKVFYKTMVGVYITIIVMIYIML